MKITPSNLRELQANLKGLRFGRSIRRKKVEIIARNFTRRHILEFHTMHKRPPVIDEVFDEIAGTLIDELKKYGNKVHLIAKFIAKVFCDVVNQE